MGMALSVVLGLEILVEAIAASSTRLARCGSGLVPCRSPWQDKVSVCPFPTRRAVCRTTYKSLGSYLIDPLSAVRPFFQAWSAVLIGSRRSK